MWTSPMVVTYVTCITYSCYLLMLLILLILLTYITYLSYLCYLLTYLSCLLTLCQVSMPKFVQAVSLLNCEIVDTFSHAKYANEQFAPSRPVFLLYGRGIERDFIAIFSNVGGAQIPPHFCTRARVMNNSTNNKN